jgi:hypothetical protein
VVSVLPRNLEKSQDFQDLLRYFKIVTTTDSPDAFAFANVAFSEVALIFLDLHPWYSQIAEELSMMEDVFGEIQESVWQDLVKFMKQQSKKGHDGQVFEFRTKIVSMLLKRAKKSATIDCQTRKRSGWSCMTCEGGEGVRFMKEILDTTDLPLVKTRAGMMMGIKSVSEIASQQPGSFVRVRGRFGIRDP